MPDQPPQDTYGPRQLEGPFAGAITPPIVRSAPHESPQQFSGWEGGTGKALGLVDKFIAGIGQGRMMRALADEQQKTNRMRKFVAWGDSIMNNPNIDPAKKSEFSNEFQRALLSETTGAVDQGSKGGKGHPIVGAMKSILTGLAGGEVIKSKYDLKAIDDVIQKYHDLPTNPQYNLQAQTESAVGNLRSAIPQIADAIRKSTGKEPTSQQVRETLEKQAPQLITQVDRVLGGPAKSGPIIDEVMKAYSGKREPTEGELKQQKEDAARARLTGNPAAQGQQPPAPTGRDMVLRPELRSASAQPPPPADTTTAQPPAAGGAQSPLATAAGKASAPPPPPRITGQQMDDLREIKALHEEKEIWVDGKKQTLYEVDGTSTGIPAGYIDKEGAYIDPKRISHQAPTEDEKAEQYLIDTGEAKDKKQAHDIVAHARTLELKAKGEPEPGAFRERKAVERATYPKPAKMSEEDYEKEITKRAGTFLKRKDEIDLQKKIEDAGGSFSGGGLARPDGDVLKGQSEEVQNTVKAIAGYKGILPTGAALRSPYWQKIISLVNAYDPTFDITQYQSRQKVRNDFTSGMAARNIRSLNTVTGHLSTLKDAADSLKNISSGKVYSSLANALKVAYEKKTQDPRLKSFDIAANAVESELATVFKGTGATDQEIKAWRSNLSASNSPEELDAAIKQAVTLMGSRMDALRNQFEVGMGKPKDFRILTPESRSILQKFGVDPNALDVTVDSQPQFNFDPISGRLVPVK